jgi:hypothetical protein
MITKSLDTITAVDLQAYLQALTDPGAPESRILAYEQELQVSSRDQRVDFRADLSSLANAAGGHIIYGIDAPSGTAIGGDARPLACAKPAGCGSGGGGGPRDQHAPRHRLLAT